jgi:hypothetical protein
MTRRTAKGHGKSIISRGINCKFKIELLAAPENSLGSVSVSRLKLLKRHKYFVKFVKYEIFKAQTDLEKVFNVPRT